VFVILLGNIGSFLYILIPMFEIIKFARIRTSYTSLLSYSASSVDRTHQSDQLKMLVCLIRQINFFIS